MAISLVLVSTLVAPLRAENIQAITASAAQINYYESHFYVKTREKMLQRQLEINKCQKDIATENNEVDDKTPVIIEETYYIDMDVPGSKPFK